ncbi:hypothetical protein DL89DRAFT_90463 [Linderina pennispora]|uniref:Uncharacterized protein n=1 Tax=Linderina pennispora TaxID=61395 RepID=A0A1Y1WI61_9FUNG|nr:uncharacterized protein DL89DRAFT_90463 [Linderina pennispora]ORX73261.1 hypothetical protein DL89DRAFT_90463 [Linderina pennispora]
MPLPGTLKATTPQPTATPDPAPAPAPTEPSELPAKRARASSPDPPVSQLSSLPNSPSKPQSLEVSNPQPADLAPPNATAHAALPPEQNQQPIAPVIPGPSLVSTQHPGNKKSLSMHTPPSTPSSSVQDGSPKQSTDPLPPPAQVHSDACTISSIVSSPVTSTATLAAVASERREGFARKSTRTRGRTLTTQAIQQYHARMAAMKTAHPVVPRKNVLSNALKRKLPEVEHPPQPRPQSYPAADQLGTGP